jgi:hypothetical protein
MIAVRCLLTESNADSRGIELGILATTWICRVPGPVAWAKNRVEIVETPNDLFGSRKDAARARKNVPGEFLAMSLCNLKGACSARCLPQWTIMLVARARMNRFIRAARHPTDTLRAKNSRNLRQQTRTWMAMAVGSQSLTRVPQLPKEIVS